MEILKKMKVEVEFIDGSKSIISDVYAMDEQGRVLVADNDGVLKWYSTEWRNFLDQTYKVKIVKFDNVVGEQ